MELSDKTVIITGATGGIGSRIALLFAERSANLVLVGRDAWKLQDIVKQCENKGNKSIGIIADLTSEEDIKKVADGAVKAFGKIDILINNAGAMSFNSIAGTGEKELKDIIMSNIYGPIRLTQSVLPHMLERKSGRIVNIGSIFGSLSFPLFGIYSASKSAIRGFSEALRRELHDTGVGVTYIAPRGTRTSQSADFLDMARKTGMNLDSPEKVAAIVLESVIKEKNEVYIGGPERLFVLINKLFPSIIDKALKKNVAVMSKYLR